MNKLFPIEAIEGKDYVLMKADVFVSFFNEITKYKTINSALLDEINKRYNSATKSKRKRIKLKREKEVLIVMYNLLFNQTKTNA